MQLQFRTQLRLFFLYTIRTCECLKQGRDGEREEVKEEASTIGISARLAAQLYVWEATDGI